jgi:hypothetical protein
MSIKQNEYVRRKSAEKKVAFHASKGNKCAYCGSNKRLEIDHIDRKTKKYNPTRFWLYPKILAEELPKCQILCHACHKEKTRLERFTERIHGVACYRRGCRCDKCVEAKKVYRGRYYKQNREKEIAYQRTHQTGLK